MTYRVTPGNRAPLNQGDHVLYWMISARRTAHSVALDHALARARELARPLVVLEALRVGYRWASDRIHTFVMAGMADNARAFANAGITYLAYVEPEEGRGAGLVEALAKRACVVVTDEQPGFFLSRMVASVAKRLTVRVEIVDGNGVLPLRAFDRAYTTAASFRRELQKIVHPYLAQFPSARPLSRHGTVRDGEIAGSILRRWPSANGVARLPIDHAVAPIAMRGGAKAGARLLDDFITRKLASYGERNHPDADATSALSPYLHFGHVGAHDVVARVLEDADWNPSRLAERATGSRTGWWGLPASHEGFLDQLITWRELGYGYCFHRRDFDRYSALPDWARATLEKHARDPRPHRYTLAELDAAETSDPIWNAAQRQLRVDGVIHNYLRMLWGKKILEWSPSPRAALARMIELNNKYAVDGRDPNSYSGILWTLGAFDRAWGPERKIFGTVRYMSSDATKRKLDITQYLAKWTTKTLENSRRMTS